MKTIKVDCVDDFFKQIEKYQKDTWWKFRGQADSDWNLIPKAGRDNHGKYKDEDMFNAWKRRAKSLIDKNYNSDWDYLAIAQHTGLPTRLLDWSHNPLIAAFFACNECNEKDGALFAFHSDNKLIKIDEYSPFEIATVGLFRPDVSHLRLGNQIGYFTIHGKPNRCFNEKNCGGQLEKIIINKSIKEEIIFKLNHFGINYLHIFPDLEGLSRHLCWFSEKYDYWVGHNIDDLNLIITKPNNGS